MLCELVPGGIAGEISPAQASRVLDDIELAGAAVPQRMARAGPSKVARMPSPVSFSWWPENRAS